MTEPRVSQEDRAKAIELSSEWRHEGTMRESLLVDYVALALAMVRAEEREACAKSRTSVAGYGAGYETSALRVPYVRGWDAGQKAMAAAIRARGGKENG